MIVIGCFIGRHGALDLCWDSGAEETGDTLVLVLVLVSHELWIRYHYSVLISFSNLFTGKSDIRGYLTMNILEEQIRSV